MCGIAGQLNLSNAAVDPNLIEQMCTSIVHRGPDDQGFYLNKQVGLGSRRLSIIDLSGGQMPIANETDTIWVVFNGEIYNFLELRADLEKRGHIFRTSTDTETIIHLYEEYGVSCLNYLNGMFSLALWDSDAERLLLARDRLGKKPLCYALLPNELIFASEISALLKHPALPRDLDWNALNSYFILSYIPNPQTIYKSIRKLPPAHYLVCEKGQVKIERYWSVDFGAKNTLSEQEAYETMTFLLKDAVQRRMISDVPIGAFLSGGLDSSTIVALMAQLSGKPIQTFSIGFDADRYGELPYAKQVAEQYETEHHELLVKPDMLDVLPRLLTHYGEPFGDSSAVATYYLASLTRESVTVALSGDGGDEVFGGYGWYVKAFTPSQQWREHTTHTLRRLWNSVRQVDPSLAYLASTDWIQGLGPLARGTRQPAYAMQQLQTFVSGHWRHRLYSSDLRHRLSQAGNPFAQPLQVAAEWGALDQLLYLDHSLYLPDDILVKVDIASMAHSLEVRCPFLDYRLVELMASLPAHYKIQGEFTKYLLHQLGINLLPASVLNRPKMGFGMPIDAWMRSDLYPAARDLLCGSSAQKQGLFNHQAVEQMLSAHRAGAANYGLPLWLLFVFQIWYQGVAESEVC